MRCHSRPYSSTTAEVTVWKAAALAILLSLTVSPALASDATLDAGAATAHLAGGTTALDQDPVDIRRLTEHVAVLEQRGGPLGAADAPPAPTAADLKRAKEEAERQAEFQTQVWTMP
jgi:hypothetical protein